MFSPKRSVTGCDSSLGSLFKSVLHFAFLHLLSGYYYYDYVVIGVLRNVAYRNLLLKRVNIVHGGKILTIIIISPIAGDSVDDLQFFLEGGGWMICQNLHNC